jgi:hypothetical protein
MKTPALVLALSLGALAALPAAADTSWSGTGPRGGTAAGSAACTAGGGAVTCNRTGTATNPWGQSATTRATRVGTADGVTVTGTRTGPAGHSQGFSRERTR